MPNEPQDTVTEGNRVPEERPQEDQAASGEKRSLVLHHEAFHSGPLPPPQLLAGYEDIVPGAAERILAMAERQAEHRQALERDMTAAQIEDSRRERHQIRIGQIFGLAVALAGLIIAGWIAEDAPWPATVIGGGTLVALVSAFIYGRHSEARTPEEPKDEDSPSQ